MYPKQILEPGNDSTPGSQHTCGQFRPIMCVFDGFEQSRPSVLRTASWWGAAKSPAKRWATRSTARRARSTARVCSSTRRTSACDDSRRTVWPGRRTRSWTRPTSGRLEADFLLLAPRELARLRDARGKPPLKIPPVSATMPGVAARGYFGQRCVAAKFPGRAFPAEPYFVKHALALTRHVVRAGADWH